MPIRFDPMDLRQRWVIARQNVHTDWEFFADRGVWTDDLHWAALFYTLWGAEEALVHSAAGQGSVRNAAEVYEFAVSGPKPVEGAEAAAWGSPRPTPVRTS